MGETRLFRGAVAAAAAAALWHAFADPAPATGVADHLSGGLAPAAVAAVLVWAYPRLRPAVRGLVALCCGALALTAGVSLPGAVGVVSALAGAVLLAVGLRVLWHSRRTDGPRARRYAVRAAHVVGALAGVYLVVLPIGFAELATLRDRELPPAVQLGRPYEPVELRTDDGLRLAGWYVPSRNGAAVIAFPGRTQPVPHARLLARHGYGVLLLDRRGEGASEGDFNAFGWDGAADLRAAVAFLRARPDVEEDAIGGLGLSVGGELLLETAATEPALRAVVSEGAGVRSIREQLHWPGIAPAVRWISPSLVTTAATAVLTGERPPADLAGLVARIAPRPVLLIRALHGNGDEVLNRVYRDAAPATTALWETDAGGHTGALGADPAAYEQRVVGFFDDALRRAP